MHEIFCPACNTPFQFDFSDFMLMCPFCSTTFKFDTESGKKDLYGDHYIVPNTLDSLKVKNLTMEWLKRMHHNPELAMKEFFVVDIFNASIPFWIISAEAHTLWKGLVKKQHRGMDRAPGSEYLTESGQFRRNYRWAVSARKNICEYWGLTRLHQPKEKIEVNWDGFPLDSTFSRGRIEENSTDKTVYDVREYFEFKFANGLPVMTIQIDDEEALRRAENHIQQYHLKLAELNSNYLIDYRTEIEVAGIQLIHLPFWFTKYIYKPSNVLRHVLKSTEKNIIISGFGEAILKSELAVIRKDKVWVNALICGLMTVILFIMGTLWHSAFFLVGLFSMVIAGISVFMAINGTERDFDEHFTKADLEKEAAREIQENTTTAPPKKTAASA